MASLLRRAVFPAFALLFWFGGVASVFGQATGTILGVVKDGSGAVVAGAKITAENQGTGISRTMVANSEGAFIFPRLPVGSYAVKAERDGFKTFESRRVLLQADQSVTLPVTLEVGD